MDPFSDCPMRMLGSCASKLPPPHPTSPACTCTPLTHPRTLSLQDAEPLIMQSATSGMVPMSNKQFYAAVARK